MFKNKKLGDIARIYTGVRISRVKDGLTRPMPVLKRTSEEYSSKLEYEIEDISIDIDPKFLSEKDDILILLSGSNNICKIEQEGFVIPMYYAIVKVNYGYDPDFIFHVLKSEVFPRELNRLMEGTSLKILKSRDLKEQMEIKKNIGSFNKFYRFLIQATAFEDVDLHRKYNYLTVLYKELDVKGIKVDFNVVQAVSISGLEQKKTGEYIIQKGTQTVDAKPEIKYINPRPVTVEMEQMKKLAEIIEEINLEKGINIDPKLAHSSLTQIKDILIHNPELKNSAMVNDYKDFNFAYYRSVDKALEEGYDHNKELYKLLLDDSDAKQRILGIYMEEIYKSLNKVIGDIPKVAETMDKFNLDNEVFARNVGRFKTISGRNIYYYGEEFGDIIKAKDNRYDKITTLNDLFGILLRCWNKETAYPASQADYVKDNDPTYGQCAITATLVHDLFGGTIHKIKVNSGGTHYFNKIDGHYIDLTRDQFDLYNIHIEYEPNEEVSREYCGKNEDTLKRFNLLVQNVEKLLNNK